MELETLLQFLNLDFPFLHDEKQSRNENYICMWTEICDVTCVNNFTKKGFDRLNYTFDRSYRNFPILFHI